MISHSRKAALAVLAAGIAAITFAPAADAATYCRARTDGFATGIGLFGAGTANARSAAVSDWAAKVNDRWGIYYANFDNARGVRWNCKKGAILQAKCSVSATPCRR
jgi:hypothetical protein